MKNLLMFLQACCCSAAGLMACRPFFHWFQLESYQFPGYFRTLKRQGFHSVVPGIVMALLSALLILVNSKVFSTMTYWLRSLICGAVLITAGYSLHAKNSRQKAKKKLVYTPRIKRLYAVSFLVWSCVLFALFLLLNNGITGRGIVISLFFLMLPFAAAFTGLLA